MTNEMPLCLICTDPEIPAWMRTWAAGGERHAAASHAITVLSALNDISRLEARGLLSAPLSDPRRARKARWIRL